MVTRKLRLRPAHGSVVGKSSFQGLRRRARAGGRPKALLDAF
jgi:hypothetical protein